MSDSFDRALRAAARRSRPAGVCPDAAMLASYADNGLSEDERRLVEAHVADCATCLEHMALVGAVSLDREAPEPSRWWLVQWRWLVPVATAVLVVAVWIRLPEQVNQEVVRTPLPAAQAEPNVAIELDRTAPLTPPPGRDNASNAAARSAPKVAKTAPERAGQLSDEKSDQLTPLERRDSARQKAANAPPPALAAAPEAAAPFEVKQADADKVQARGATSRVASPPAAVTPRAAEAIREEAQVADAGRRREADGPLSRAEAPALVVSASAKESYRAAGNQIELSEDGGANWRAVSPAAPGIFTAAGCGAGGPCWFGTADGQLWRRTPDGFSRHALPVRQPVIAITVEGAQTVVVTVEGGRRFRTANGGASWNPIP
jgi:Putative zinc-finger